MRNIVVLGSTGSIGRQALDVIAAHPDEFALVALCAGENLELLAEQAERMNPVYAGLSRLPAGQARAPSGLEVGEEVPARFAALAEADTVLIAMSGIAAFAPLLAAIDAGKHIALANKESVVCGGAFLQERLRASAARLIPVDSEHSAIYQCLAGNRREDVLRLILTASGGPFWDWPQEAIAGVTPEQALRHPIWDMGEKITIDSATLANKGLEVIEARYLFDMPPERIDVLIHREAVVHSFVEMRDGSVFAQLGAPDMRLPIQFALTSPARLPSPGNKLDFSRLGALHFSEPDFARFPMLSLAYEALGRPGAPVVYCGANDAAVARFLAGEIGFSDIPRLVERALGRISGEARSMEEIAALYARAVEWASNFQRK